MKENKKNVPTDNLFSAALLLYRKRKLSLGKAAELVGFSKIDFIEKLNQENEFVFDYNDQELNEIIDDATRIKTK